MGKKSNEINTIQYLKILMRAIKILYIALAILVFFLFLYLLIFHHGLSVHHEEWGSFGNFIGDIGGIVLTFSMFYYEFTIDKDHRRTENNANTLKLIDIISESLTFVQRWQELDREIENGSIYDRGQITNQNLMRSERDKLVIRIWTNYKTVQILANQIYGMDIPNVKEIYDVEQNLLRVFHHIKL